MAIATNKRLHAAEWVGAFPRGQSDRIRVVVPEVNPCSRRIVRAICSL